MGESRVTYEYTSVGRLASATYPDGTAVRFEGAEPPPGVGAPASTTVAAADEQVFCTRCGARLAAGSAFCMECGTPVD